MKRKLIGLLFACSLVCASAVRAEVTKAEVVSVIDALLDEGAERGASSPFNQVIKIKIDNEVMPKLCNLDAMTTTTIIPKLCDINDTVTTINENVNLLSMGMTVTSLADLLLTATVIPKLCDIQDTVTATENTIDTSLLPKVCTMLMSVTNIELLTTTTVIPKVCDILDTVTNLELCAPTPITQADVPFAIATSGHYCLAENITVGEASAITIAVDGVTLDLNGYTIATNGSTTSARGILITSGASCVTVANGYIDGSGTAFEGICIDSTGGPSQNLILKDLVIKGFGASGGTGIEVESVDNLTVERVYMLDNNLYGIDIIAAATHVVVKDCVALGNSTNYNILGTRILIQDSLANQAAFDGFEFGGSANDVCLVRCEAKDNGRDGFREDSGSLGTIMVRECSALGNTGAGFFGVAGGALGQYVGNFADGNGTDYDNVDFTGVMQAVSGWENVDASDSVGTHTVINKLCDILDTVTAMSSGGGACDPTPITAPQSISQSGHYCLANDINGTIPINADNVTFDLNGYTITFTGATSNDAAVRIENGLSGVTVRNGNIVCTGSSARGVGKLGTTTLSSKIIVEDVVIEVTTGVCISMRDIQNIKIVNCFLKTTGSNSAGVSFFMGDDVLVKDVVAMGQGTSSSEGISIAFCDRCTVDSCIAENFATGFLTGSNNDNLVINCKALDNSGIGFSGSAGTEFGANFASGNGTNYSGITNSAIGVGVTYWDNTRP